MESLCRILLECKLLRSLATDCGRIQQISLRWIISNVHRQYSSSTETLVRLAVARISLDHHNSWSPTKSRVRLLSSLLISSRVEAKRSLESGSKVRIWKEWKRESNSISSRKDRVQLTHFVFKSFFLSFHKETRNCKMFNSKILSENG